MIANIVVIGSGNIGSRHVQSLANSLNKINIFVIDPKRNNLIKTKKLFFETKFRKKKNINIFFNQTITKINNSIDLAIISTNSDIRREVIEKLVSLNDVKNIILEKVAFQNMNDFDFIVKLLNKNKIKSFINFPRRILESYQKLKREIKNKNKIHISFIGKNWGLASNSLHMLDLLTYLTNAKKIFVEEVSLKNRIYNSPRKGFIELKGTLKFITNRGDFLHLCDLDQYKKNVSFLGIKHRGVSFGGIKIENENFSYLIYENYKKIVKVSYNSEFSVDVNSFESPLQSMLTNQVVDNLIRKNKIYLPKLKDSYYHHKIILNIVNNHILKCDTNIHGCPIT